MITEDYVSYDVAMLLKEKGFDGNTNCYYIEGSVDKNLYYSPIRENHNKRITNNEFEVYIDITNSKISAPTLQMAMKWLREVYKIDIDIRFYWKLSKQGYSSNGYRFDLHYANAPSHFVNKVFETYEQACEAGIKYCLTNLI